MEVSVRSALSVGLVALAVIALVGCATGRIPDRGGILRSSEVGTHNPPLVLTVDSDLLGENRRIYVQLPEDYHRSDRRYPVLVVLDGEWLFELARAHARFHSEYAVMDINIPRMIVVGIENTDRDRNYTPTRNSGEDLEFPTAGEADRFLEFLHSELMPLLDGEYRTAPARAVAGWSFGGLLAMYSAVAMPELFQAHLCISPAIWWDDDLVIEKFREARFDRPKRIVITLGAGEEGGWVYCSSERILERFEADPIPNLEVSRLEFEGVGHTWSIPAAFDRGLRELFAGYLPPPEIAGGSMEQIAAYYEELSSRWGFHIDPPAPVMQDLALARWAEGEKDEAIAALDRLLAYEPDASLAIYFKGRFLHLTERPEAALVHYRESQAAEMRRDVPNEIHLRMLRGLIRETEAELAGTEGAG